MATADTAIIPLNEGWRIFFMEEDVAALPALLAGIVPQTDMGRAEKAILAARTHLRLGHPDDAFTDLTEAAEAADQTGNPVIGTAVAICITEYLLQTRQAEQARSCAATSLSMVRQARPDAGDPKAPVRIAALQGRATLLAATCARCAGAPEEVAGLVARATRLARAVPDETIVSGCLFGPNALNADLFTLYLDADDLALAARYARRVRQDLLPYARRREYDQDIARLVERLRS